MIFKLIINVLSNFFIITGIGIFIFTYFPIVYYEVSYRLNPPEVSDYIESKDHSKPLAQVDPDSENISAIKPADESFSVIIPKIGVNAPVIPDVSTVNEKEYMDALRKGVAHARGTAYPGEDGNMFLFAHSSLNFWQLGPYATVFNLLNKLEKDDLVVMVRDEDTFVYKVFSTEVIPGWNTAPFFEEYDGSVVTLITCYPPGTTVNRYVVKAKLVRDASKDIPSATQQGSSPQTL